MGAPNDRTGAGRAEDSWANSVPDARLARPGPGRILPRARRPSETAHVLALAAPVRPAGLRLPAGRRPGEADRPRSPAADRPVREGAGVAGEGLRGLRVGPRPPPAAREDETGGQG